MLQGTNPDQVAAIVRPNNPPQGIGGFLFDLPGEEIVELRSRSSEYYLEDNTAISDQVSLEPERVTLNGIVAELATSQPQQAAPQSVPDPLPLNSAMVPSTTSQPPPTAVLSTPGPNSIYDYYETQSNIAAASGNATTQVAMKNTRQTDAFLYFYALWQARQLCSVETPYGLITNMIIDSLRASQPSESNQHSEFQVVFKKLRFAQDISVQVGTLAGRTVNQATPVLPTGNTGQIPLTSSQATQVQQSWLAKFFGP